MNAKFLYLLIPLCCLIDFGAAASIGVSSNSSTEVTAILTNSVGIEAPISVNWGELTRDADNVLVISGVKIWAHTPSDWNLSLSVSADDEGWEFLEPLYITTHRDDTGWEALSEGYLPLVSDLPVNSYNSPEVAYHVPIKLKQYVGTEPGGSYELTLTYTVTASYITPPPTPPTP